MRHVARGLARALLSDEAGGLSTLQQNAAAALGRKWPWLARLIRKLDERFGLPLRPDDFENIVAWLLAQPSFIAAFHAGREKPRIYRYFSFQPRMAAAASALSTLVLPVLHTAGDLAAWLGLSIDELDWLADIGAWRGKSEIEPRRHYRYHWKPKASGGQRLIESPKPLLRSVQRKILRGMLDKVPVHAAAHGCVPGRSIVSNAHIHAGTPLVLKLDLRDFFTSIPAARIHALFRSLGYPLEVARYLTALTTHATAPAALRAQPQESLCSCVAKRATRASQEAWRQRHLPQGAPTSAALANLCAWRLDLRLDGAAREAGARYTRYVDDLVFSCPAHSPAHARRIALMAASIALEEGFTPHPHKTRIATQAQAQWVTGVLVNQKPNVARKDFDLLKAILNNCIRHGPTEQNREAHLDFRAHLQGRVAHVRHVNPARGARLQTLFAKICWPDKSA
ncbi:reverse transcriptase family protein [Uliginosibacterium sp. 31-16]|uniref:reverse transcriptase family protein n=1 Tax=Uliginosibacterium sp. 31-16 TaxID=3068315 RepID=UPI00273FAAA6|nr:reverse transcriptase family protein [Uliginosibacterium sp. 31-16]MDP5239733.1 reverse transcriptase family protein [Uliginosibacterium sp. 31-16]